MIKLAYCVPYLWNPGGIDRVITVKANYLAEVLGNDVTIITCDQQGVPPYFPLSPKIRTVDVGINFYTYHGTQHNRIEDFLIRIWRSTWKRWLFRRRLAKALQEIRPDITISVSRRELPFLYKIKAGGIKIAERHMCHNNRLNHPSSSFIHVIYQYLTHKEDILVGKYDYAVTLTEEDKALWHNNKNMLVIPNPLTEQATSVSSLDSKQVVAVGRICSEKGYDRLVKSWSLIEKKIPDWKLIIVGSQDDISQTDLLKEEIKRLELKNVQLMPHTHSIGDIYSQASILALTSHYEGLPLVVLEAMSYGVPCVAMACQCGPRDIITDGKDGILVPEGDIEAFASGLEHLMKDDTARKHMGTAALQRSKNYALPEIMSRWDKLFRNLVK